MAGKWQRDAYEEDGQTRYAYATTIPEGNGETQILSLRVYWCSMDVLVDDKEIYSYQDGNNSKGTCQLWIELPKGSEGMKLSLRTPEGKDYLNVTIAKDCYIGERSSVFYRFLMDNLSALCLSVITLLFGAGILLCGRILKKKPIFDNMEMKYLGLFMVTSGAWILTDSRFLQLLTGETGVIAIASFILFMLMPYYMMRFLNEMMIEKKKSMNVMCSLLLLNMVISLTLHMLHIVRIFQIIAIHHVLIIITLILMIKYGYEEIVKYKNEEMRIIQIGLIIMVALCGLALFVFYVSPALPYAVLYGSGIVIFEVFLAIAAFKKLYFHLERSASMAAYHELAYKDVMTGLSNRAGFVEAQENHRDFAELAYIIFDLNGLKKVNDHFGHREGDRLIIQAAACIRDVFESMGKCFRIGGDEFLVMLENATEDKIIGTLEVLDKNVKMLNQTRDIPISFAYGYALRNENAESVEHLFNRADESMYQKKSKMKKEANQ